jgi:hypothetical protein
MKGVTRHSSSPRIHCKPGSAAAACPTLAHFAVQRERFAERAMKPARVDQAQAQLIQDIVRDLTIPEKVRDVGPY